MPAAQRKPAATSGATGSSRLPEWHTRQVTSWTPVADEVLDNIHDICVGIEIRIIFTIIRRTVGTGPGKEKPEWVTLSYEDFRQAGVRVSDRAIANALASLGEGRADEDGEVEIDGKHLIESKPSSYSRAYRVLYQNFPGAKRLEPRTIDKLPVAAAAGQRTRLGYGQPQIFTPPTPATSIEIVRRTNGDLPLEMQTTVQGSVVKVSLYMPEVKGEASSTDGTPVQSVGPESATEEPATDGSPLQSVAGPLSQVETVKILRGALADVFLRCFDKGVDQAFALRIAKALGVEGATAADTQLAGRKLAALIEKRNPNSSGIVLAICGDVRSAIETAARVNRRTARISRGDDAPPPLLPEHQEEDSPWGRIRAAMRAKITPTEFENWLERTVFVDVADGTITVRVPDDLTAKYIGSEFGEQVRATAWELNLEVDEFRFVAEVAKGAVA